MQNTEFMFSLNGTKYDNPVEFIKALASIKSTDIRECSMKIVDTTEEQKEDKKDKTSELLDVIDKILNNKQQSKCEQNCVCEHKKEVDQDEVVDELCNIYIPKETTYVFKGKEDKEELQKYNEYLDNMLKQFSDDERLDLLDYSHLDNLYDAIVEECAEADNKACDMGKLRDIDEDIAVVEKFIDCIKKYPDCDASVAQNEYNKLTNLYDIERSKIAYYSIKHNYLRNLEIALSEF